MANVGFHHAMRQAGIDVVSSKVGDRYVLEDMLRSGAVLGGELYGDTLGGPDSRGATVVGMLVANAGTIVRGLTGRPCAT